MVTQATEQARISHTGLPYIDNVAVGIKKNVDTNLISKIDDNRCRSL